jgi:hypothetical protein
VKEFDTTDL